MSIKSWFIVIYVLSICTHSKMSRSFVKLRGNVGSGLSQSLPVSLTKSWKIWTYRNSYLERLEDEISDLEENGEDNLLGWVNPISYDDFYLPADLPIPKMEAAVGLVIINGTPRYIMPSVILTLETPGKSWRNRGMCSVPRANVWIDLFGEYSNIAKMKFYCFGQFSPDVRFLEDQDGANSWENLLNAPETSMFRPQIDNTGYDILSSVETFKQYMKSSPNTILSEGYHIVDIPLLNARPLRMKGNSALGIKRIKSYLTDLSYPSDLLGMEETSDLDTEPIGELDAACIQVSPGGDSEFLPEAYIDLYEPGSIIA